MYRTLLATCGSAKKENDKERGTIPLPHTLRTTCGTLPFNPPITPPQKTEDMYYQKGLPKDVTHSNLPHWSKACTLLFVTFRLVDSIPAGVANHIIANYNFWKKNQPGNLTEQQLQLLYQNECHKKISQYLDAKPYGSCMLKRPAVRTIVEEEIRRYDGEHYDLKAFVIMPNHVHLLLMLYDGYSLSTIMHSIKRMSSFRINKLLATPNQTIWRRESFDCLVRSAAQHRKLRDYIFQNPKYQEPNSFTLWLKEEPELYAQQA